MKLYSTEPAKVVRLQISRQGDEREYLTFDESSKEFVMEELKKMLKDKCSVFPTGKVTRMDIREATGAKNLKSISFKFFGLSPKETKEIILQNLDK